MASDACLGKDVTAKTAELRGILGWDIDQVQKAIVIVLLRRYFQPCKLYWDLMEAKAVDYLRLCDRDQGYARGSRELITRAPRDYEVLCYHRRFNVMF